MWYINRCILTSIQINIRDLKYGLNYMLFFKDIAGIRENYDPCTATERSWGILFDKLLKPFASRWYTQQKTFWNKFRLNQFYQRAIFLTSMETSDSETVQKENFTLFTLSLPNCPCQDTNSLYWSFYISYSTIRRICIMRYSRDMYSGIITYWKHGEKQHDDLSWSLSY